MQTNFLTFFSGEVGNDFESVVLIVTISFFIFQRPDVPQLPGYLSLHQNAVGQIAIRWTPNEMMNHGGEEQQGGDSAGEPHTSSPSPQPVSVVENPGTCNSAPATADVLDSSDRM